MRRDYAAGGKRITVDQLEELVAVRFGGPETVEQVKQGAKSAWWRGKRLMLADESDLPITARSMLAQGNWVLMRPAEGEPDTADSVEPVAIGRLYRDEAGELMIGTARVTVRLRDNLEKTAAIDLLTKHGLAIKRQLKFAPNLFEVEADSPDRALAVSAEATDDQDILYAEPQMLRNLGGRS